MEKFGGLSVAADEVAAVNTALREVLVDLVPGLEETLASCTGVVVTSESGKTLATLVGDLTPEEAAEQFQG